MTDEQFQRRINDRFDRDSRRSRQRLLLCLVLGLYGLIIFQVSHSATIPLRCTPPTKNTDGTPLTDLAGIKWLYGPAPNALVPLKRTMTCEAEAENLSVGTWFFAAKAVNASDVESALSNIPSATITATPPPRPDTPLVATMRVIDPRVYSPGTFDRLAWLVRPNLNTLYGSIAVGSACDISRPAQGGYYRVNPALVKWANTRAKTAHPIAKCAWSVE